MNGSWTFKINNEHHTVRVSIPRINNKMSVYFDASLIYDSIKWFGPFGELCRFEKLGQQFVIKVQGFGHLGKLKLYINGYDADNINDLSGAPESLEVKAATPQAWQYSIVSIVETQRIIEPLGEETREIDNSKSNIQVLRKITVSREWSQSFIIDHEKTKSFGGRVDLKLPFSLNINANLEKVIKEKYSISIGIKYLYSEEVTLTIPAKTRVQVIFVWKQIWQCGIITIRDLDNTEWQIPFRFRLEPTFDQRQIDHVT